MGDEGWGGIGEGRGEKRETATMTSHKQALFGACRWQNDFLKCAEQKNGTDQKIVNSSKPKNDFYPVERRRCECRRVLLCSSRIMQITGAFLRLVRAARSSYVHTDVMENTKSGIDRSAVTAFHILSPDIPKVYSCPLLQLQRLQNIRTFFPATLNLVCVSENSWSEKTLPSLVPGMILGSRGTLFNKGKTK